MEIISSQLLIIKILYLLLSTLSFLSNLQKLNTGPLNLYILLDFLYFIQNSVNSNVFSSTFSFLVIKEAIND